MPILSQKPNTEFITPEQKKQKKMIYILLGVVLVTVVVLYFGFFSGSDEQAAELNAVPGSLPGQSAADQAVPGAENANTAGASAALSGAGSTFAQKLSSLENVNLDFGIFQDTKFQSLKSFGSSPDMSGPKGRPNPFSPY
jgi:hypothetical protein